MGGREPLGVEELVRENESLREPADPRVRGSGTSDGRDVSEPSTPAVRVGSVVIDCNDFDRMLAFWREALGHVPRDEPDPGWVVLADPEGNLFRVIQKDG